MVAPFGISTPVTPKKEMSSGCTGEGPGFGLLVMLGVMEGVADIEILGVIVGVIEIDGVMEIDEE